MAAKRKAKKKKAQKRTAKKRTTKRKAAKRKPAKRKTAKRKPAKKKAVKRKKKVAKKKAAKRKPAQRKAAKKKTKRKPKVAFMRPVTPDALLSAVVGAAPLPRTELTKKLWIYIKKNGLQDATKRTMINADSALKVVFGGKRKVDMFQMTKLVSRRLHDVT